MDQKFFYINRDDMDKTMITLNYGYGIEQLSIQKLLDQRNSLITENSQLKNLLYFNTKFSEDTRTILTNQINNLSKNIEQLTRENINIKIVDIDKKVDILTIQVNELLKDKKLRDKKKINILSEEAPEI